MLAVIAVPFVHLLVRVLFVYHPSKTKLAFVGFGALYAVPDATVTASMALPPFVLKETVQFVGGVVGDVVCAAPTTAQAPFPILVTTFKSEPLPV